MPIPFDLTRYYGDPAGFLAWSGGEIVRTADITAASPTWERTDTGISGTIVDCQVVPVDSSTAGAWLLTSAAVYWCADIGAAAPVWTSVLSLATVQTSDPVPTADTVEFKCFGTYWSDSGYCIVATGPMGGANGTGNQDYAHAIFWMTDDHGDTWSSVDVGGVTGPGGYSYCYAGRFALEVFPEPVNGGIVVWCVRSTPTDVLNFNMRLFESLDGGQTWSASATSFASGANNRVYAGLLMPYGDLTDAAYVINGSVGVSDRPDLRRSTDSFDTVTTLTSNGDPTGYGGINNATSPYRRAGQRYGAPLHVLAWFRESSTATAHLLESENSGDDFTLLHDQNTGAGYMTPINWPADPNFWAWVVDASGGDISNFGTTPPVMVSEDNFATVEDRNGDLSTVLSGTWSAGSSGGCFLPKTATLLDASLTTWLRVQAARQANFGSAEVPTFALPVTFEYQDGDVDHVAAWDEGTWTPTEIVERVATFAEFKLRGALFYELLPVFLAAGFAPMTPSGLGPYTYSGGTDEAAVGVPAPYTFRLGGNQGSGGSMVQIADAYLRMLTLTFNLNTKIVTFESDWFGAAVDDNSGAGYAPAAVVLPTGLTMVNGLLSSIGIQDAGASGGAFSALTAFDCSFLEWQLSLDTGLRPAWASDQNGLTYCGVRHEAPSLTFSPHIRTNATNYAITLTKAQARTFQELQLTFGATNREWVLQMTGRWLGKLGGHERSRGEIVMKPTFQAATPHTQTTTPHLVTWSIESGWSHP